MTTHDEICASGCKTSGWSDEVLLAPKYGCINVIPVILVSLPGDGTTTTSPFPFAFTVTTEPFTAEALTTESAVKCPDDITTELRAGEAVASVSWIHPNGGRVFAEVPVGRHPYKTVLPDGSSCNFTVTVEGKKISMLSL